MKPTSLGQSWDLQLSDHVWHCSVSSNSFGEIWLWTQPCNIYFPKFLLNLVFFFGFKHNFHQTLIYVAYAYHTWMESCACQLNFDTKMSGLAYVPKEQGILLTVRKNSGLQPDTASYTRKIARYVSIIF